MTSGRNGCALIMGENGLGDEWEKWVCTHYGGEWAR